MPIQPRAPTLRLKSRSKPLQEAARADGGRFASSAARKARTSARSASSSAVGGGGGGNASSDIEHPLLAGSNSADKRPEAVRARFDRAAADDGAPFGLVAEFVTPGP